MAFPADALIRTYARIAPSWTNFDLQNTGLVDAKMEAMTSMPAVVKATAGPGAEIDQIAIPQPTGKHVLIEVAASSICGTDVPTLDWNDWARRHTHSPRGV